MGYPYFSNIVSENTRHCYIKLLGLIIGPGDMEVSITDDKRRQVAVKVKDTGVGTYHAEYTADKPGMHFIRSVFIIDHLLFVKNLINQLQ
jgi:hypothetical protein